MSGADEGLDSINASADQTGEKIRGLGDAFRQLAQVAVGASLIKGMFDLAVQVDAVSTKMRGLGAVVGEAVAQDIQGWASTAGAALDLTGKAAADAAITFGIYAKQASLAGDDAKDFVTDLTAVGAELAAFSGYSADEAVTALGAALRGEYDPLEKFGVALKQAEVNAYAVEQGLAASTSSVDAQARTLAVYGLALERSQFAMGAVERASTTLTGQLGQLEVQTGRLRGAAGQGLADSFAPLVGIFSSLVGAVANIPGPLLSAATAFGAIAGSVRLLSGPLVTAATAFQGLFASVSGGAGKMQGLAGTLRGLATPANLAAGGIGLLAAGFVAFTAKQAENRRELDATVRALEELDRSARGIELAEIFSEKSVPFFERTVSGIDNYLEAMDLAGESTNELAYAVTELSDSQFDQYLAELGRNAAESGGRLGEAYGLIRTEALSLRTALERQEATQSSLQAVTGKTAEELQAMADGSGSASVSLDDMRKNAEDAQKAFEDLVSSIGDIGSATRDAIEVKVDLIATEEELLSLAKEAPPIEIGADFDLNLETLRSLSPEQRDLLTGWGELAQGLLDTIQWTATVDPEFGDDDVQVLVDDWLAANADLFKATFGIDINTAEGRAQALVLFEEITGIDLEDWELGLDTSRATAEMEALKVTLAEKMGEIQSILNESVKSDFFFGGDEEWQIPMSIPDDLGLGPLLDDVRTTQGEIDTLATKIGGLGDETVEIQVEVDGIEGAKSEVVSVSAIADDNPAKVKLTVDTAGAVSNIRAVAEQDYQAEITTRANILPALQNITAVKSADYQATITVNADVARAFSTIQAVARQPYKAEITAYANVANAYRTLQGVARQRFSATIRAEASIRLAELQLQFLARDRTAIIYARTVPVGATPSQLAAARGLSAGGAGAAPVQVTRVEIAGREVEAVVRSVAERARSSRVLDDLMAGV